MKLDACCVWIQFKLASTFIALVLARRSSRFSVQLHHHHNKKLPMLLLGSVHSLGLCARIFGRFAPSGFVLCTRFPGRFTPSKPCRVTELLCSIVLCARFLVALLPQASCFALAFLVALLSQSPSGLLGRFTSSSFVLRTRILSRFAPSGLTFAFLVASLRQFKLRATWDNRVSQSVTVKLQLLIILSLFLSAFPFNLWGKFLSFRLFFHSIFFFNFLEQVSLLSLSNHNPFLCEHIFEGFNKFPSLVYQCTVIHHPILFRRVRWNFTCVQCDVCIYTGPPVLSPI